MYRIPSALADPDIVARETYRVGTIRPGGSRRIIDGILGYPTSNIRSSDCLRCIDGILGIKRLAKAVNTLFCGRERVFVADNSYAYPDILGRERNNQHSQGKEEHAGHDSRDKGKSFL
jgi:hypothetical protein